METGAISHAEIEVTVKDSDGAVLPGVTGTLQGGRIDERTEVSDAHGHMKFAELPPGTYELTLSQDGYAGVIRDVTLHETDEHEALDIVLSAAGG